MSGLLQDLRFSLRTLAKQPAFSLTALVMLILGIGSNAAIFGLFNGFFLRPLPFHEPNELVEFNTAAPRWNLETTAVAYPDFYHWRERNQSFEWMAVSAPQSYSLSTEGSSERIRGTRVSHDMAEVLGIQPILGRDFNQEDDLPEAPNTVLLTEGLWQERFGGATDVLGQSLRLNAEPYTIVGVLPNEAAFVGEARLWTPLRQELEPESGNYNLWGVGRLRDGATMDGALADLERIHANLQEEGISSQDTHPVLFGVVERQIGDSRGPLMALMAAVGLLLLIACANIAGLMLARGLARRKEIGIRVALGAGRGRVIRQLLTENLVLAGVGGVLGSLAGIWGMSILMALSPDDPPAWVNLDPDLRFMAFVVALVALTTVLSGLAPALRTVGRKTRGLGLDAASRSTGGHERNRGLKALVITEVALSVVLLLVAGLGMRDLQTVMAVEPGFETEGILTYSLSLPEVRYDSRESRLLFYEDYLERIRALPGVEMAGGTSATPMAGHWGQFFRPEGAPELGPDDVLPVTLNRVVTPGYMEAQGIQLLSGRYFDESDGRDEGSRSVILNETWATSNFPEGDALGRRIRANWEGAPWMIVVGITLDVKHYGLDEEMRQGIFQPMAQVPLQSLTMVLRTQLDPLSLVPQIRELTRSLDVDVPLIEPRTMQQILDISVWPRRMAAWLFSGFGALALILAVGGIYGVLSYIVTQRKLEIGIRMALGARDNQVLTQVVRQGMTWVGIGVGIGLLGGYAMARAISTIFFGVGTGSVFIYASVVAVLLIVGTLANLIPARRAARVSPMGALRAGE